MAEEDEIDILGDFTLENLCKSDSPNFITSTSPNSDYLNTHYSKWLLEEKPSTPNWFDPGETFPDLSLESSSNTIDTLPCTDDIINDESGWTQKEKSLLARGIDIFGKSSQRLSQFIGSRSPAQVGWYLRNFYSDVKKCRDIGMVFDEIAGEMIIDKEIPASIEEVIETVSTAKPTVPQFKRKINRKSMKSKDGLVDLKKKIKFPYNKTFVSSQQVRKITEQKAEIITGKGLSVPVFDGEQIVKISKENPNNDSESDLEIDVEDTSDNLLHQTQIHQVKNEPIEKQKSENYTLEDLDPAIVKQLLSLETPKTELIMNVNTITDLEKFVNSEFFEGKSAKTPTRYMKVRNHMLNVWQTSKPAYITKTSARQGLKNCGDVNSLGRIHQFLEQIGAINFNCPQVNYIRPLMSAIQTTPKISNKVKNMDYDAQQSDVMPRSRNKKKIQNEGEGGCTMSHNESGEVIHTMIVNEEPIQKKNYTKTPIIKLIYCRKHTNDQKQAFSVTLNLSALLLMDLHSHTSLSEVMGLIGGTWDSRNRRLFVSDYEPCDNRASSVTHCDMCPVSQAKAADSILGRGSSIVGWFHSHPTFAPEPSQQDLDTQLLLQRGLGDGRPCVGVILSPFLSANGLSPFTCLSVERMMNFEDRYVPYKLEVEVISEGFDVDYFLSCVRNVFSKNSESTARFGIQQCFQDKAITYFDKMLLSIKLHLTKCEDTSKMICDELLDGLNTIFNELKNSVM